MRSAIRVRVAFCFLIFASGTVPGYGQAYTPPPPPLSTLPPCPVEQSQKPAKKRAAKDCDPANLPSASSSSEKAKTPPPDSAGQKFPYPGDPPEKAAQAFPYPGDPERADSPNAPVKGAPGTYTADPNVPHDPVAEKKATATPAGKAFPYPGDPEPVQPSPASGADTPGQPQSSSSSSSSSDGDASNPNTAAKSDATDDEDRGEKPKLTDKGSEGKRNRKTIKPQTNDDRVDEDLSVAKFYGQSGNAVGAYLRAKDAVKTEPDYAEAHFVLGEAAKRLKKQDEAKAEFEAYLKLAPTGERAKAAEKALETLP